MYLCCFTCPCPRPCKTHSISIPHISTPIWIYPKNELHQIPNNNIYYSFNFSSLSLFFFNWLYFAFYYFSVCFLPSSSSQKSTYNFLLFIASRIILYKVYIIFLLVERKHKNINKYFMCNRDCGLNWRQNNALACVFYMKVIKKKNTCN